MRHGIFALALLAVSIVPAQAQYLARAASLRLEPSVRAPIIAMLPAGARIAVAPGPKPGWSSVLVGEISGFSRTKALTLTEIPVNAEAAAVAMSCDLGYPYSGSAPYFGGLVAWRTSGPLSFLLGRHIARPC